MGSENHPRPEPVTVEIPDNRYYQVKMAAGEDGCSHCGAGKMWAIVYVEHGHTEETEIGQTFGDKELADDICDLMNMAYEAGLEVAPAANTQAACDELERLANEAAFTHPETNKHDEAMRTLRIHLRALAAADGEVKP